MEHSTYRGATIFKEAKGWKAELEDGMYTYSILIYEAETLQGIKDQVNEYYARIQRAYK